MDGVAWRVARLGNRVREANCAAERSVGGGERVGLEGDDGEKRAERGEEFGDANGDKLVVGKGTWCGLEGAVFARMRSCLGILVLIDNPWLGLV